MSQRFVAKAGVAIGIAIVTIQLGGCVRRGGCPTCNREMDVCPTAPGSLAAVGAGIAASLQQRAAEGPSVLLLSGGGANGAWGAGVLNGWSQRTEGRPVFQVVTGISTGALISTFAFLGSKYDAVLKDEYTNASKGAIYADRCWLWLPFSSSLKDTGPLRKRIATRIPNELIDEVARIGDAEQRQLYVGTANLDSGGFAIWDMVKLARDREHDRYREVILAAAAIPALFPPVDICGDLHVDGGVRMQIFSKYVLDRLWEGYRTALANIARDEGIARVRTIQALRVYSIVNGKLVTEQECVSDRIIPIAGRSIQVLLNEAMIGNLYRAREEVAASLPSEAPAPTFFVSYVPDDYCIGAESSDFNTDAMRRLYAKGEEAGRAGDWYEGVPLPDVSPIPCGACRNEGD